MPRKTMVPYHRQIGSWQRAMAAMALLSAANLRAADAWLRCDSPEVRVLSDASAHDVTEFTVQYGAFRRTLVHFFKPDGASPPASVVVLFRRQSELLRWAARAGNDKLISASTEPDHTAVLAVALGAYRSDALTIAFESDTEDTLPLLGYFLPLWMRQGTAEVFSSAQLDRGRCILGEPQDRLTTPLDSGWLPWDRFFAIGLSSPEYKGTTQSGVYQAQAWLLMHEVLLTGDGRARFGDLIQRLGKTWQEKAALEAVLGRPEGEFDRGLNLHLKKSRPLNFPFDEAGFRAGLKLEPASEAEVAVRLADLLTAAGKETAADAQVDRAAALAPSNPLVAEAQARRELRRNQHQAAVGYYRTAIQNGSTDPDAFAVSAADRMDQSSSGGIDYPGDCVTEGDAVLREVRQAVALDRGEIYYWQLLGRAFFVVPAVAPADVAELSQAISDDPGGLEVRYYRGLLCSRLGRLDDCRADVQYVLENKQTSSYRRHWAQSYLAHLDFDRDRLTVNSLTNAQRYDEARDLLNQRLQEGVDRSVRGNYESLQRYVDEFADWHQAVNFRQNRQWSELLAATTSFLDKYPLSANRRVIRSWQEQAQRELALPAASRQP